MDQNSAAHKQQPGLWQWMIPLLFGAWVMYLFLHTFFQEDDFAILCWLRYDHPSPVDWFTVWYMGLWRPFQLASLWLEARLFGGYPEGYRMVHGIIFLFSIYLYQKMIYELCGHFTAFIAALFFAATLSHWQALQWICASGEIWMGFFFLLCLHSMLAYQKSSTAYWRWCIILSHLMALLCKGSSVVLFPMILIFLAVQQSLRTLKCPIVLLGLSLPWLGIFAFRVSIASQGEAVEQGVFSLTGWHLVNNMGAFYLRMVTHWWSQPPFFACAICLLVVLALGWYLLFQKYYFAFGIWLWSLFAVLPYAGVDTPGLYPSRYTYLAGMGFFWLLAIIITYIVDQIDFPKRALMCTLCICMFLQTLGALFLPEIKFFLRHDEILQQRLTELRELNLPQTNSIWIEDIEAPSGLDKKEFFRHLYALTYDPPQKVWIAEQPKNETPDIFLYIENGRLVYRK